MAERFLLQKSELKENYFVCTDTENLIMCIYEKHNFNDNQEFQVLKDFKFTDTTANDLARIVREMSDWLRENHYDTIF
jgi:hypothetical protein